MRRATGSSVLWILCLLLLAACGGDAPGAGEVVGDPTPGGMAVVGIPRDFEGFNPVTTTAFTSLEVINFALFTPLVRHDENLNIVPHLAESWELTDNGVTFRLRDDVRWHDGQPVTAEDVKFTFDLAKNPESASLLEAAFLTMIESATVIDPRTIRFDFVAPHSQPLEAFVWPPLPRHRLQDVAPAELGQAPFNREPVGSGPYRFVSWDAGQRLTLEANPDFPQALGGRPYLDRVVFRIVPESTTRLTELLTGAIDVNYSVLPDEAQQIQNQRGVELRHYPGRRFTYLGWNNEREPFRDPRVRRALAMAIDRQQMVDALLFGYGEPAAGMIPPWSPLYAGIDPLPYDPEGARRLLAEAGWADANGDGIVERAGQPLRFNLMVNTANRLYQDVATVLQQQFRQIGVDMQIRAVEFQTQLRQHRARDYEAVISNWVLDNFKVDPSPLISCAEARREGSANRAGYCNPQADQLIQAGLRETDEGQARETWSQLSQILQQDQPITFLFWDEELTGVGPRIQGVDTDVRGDLVNIARWWMPEDRRR